MKKVYTLYTKIEDLYFKFNPMYLHFFAFICTSLPLLIPNFIRDNPMITGFSLCLTLINAVEFIVRFLKSKYEFEDIKQTVFDSISEQKESLTPDLDKELEDLIKGTGGVK